MATVTFAADVLTITDNNAGNFISTFGEFGAAGLPTQIAFAASLGNLATITRVDVFGNGGNDTIVLDDLLIEVSPGVQGASYLVFAGNGADVVTGSAYADTIYGGNGGDVLFGGGGGDRLYGDAGNDTLHGDAGNDTLYGGLGRDDLYGGVGADLLFGEDGNDRLFGGGGADILHGGKGNDAYTGGAGADRFMFNTFDTGDANRILDWHNGNDKIDLTGVAGLRTVEVIATGAGSLQMALLGAAGQDLMTIDVTSFSGAAGRNILLQGNAYGVQESKFVKLNAGVTVVLPADPVVMI